MPLSRPFPAAALLPVATVLLLAAACVFRVEPPFARAPAPPPRLAAPAPGSNLVINGSFEEVSGDDPAAWKISGRGRGGARVGSRAIPGAPDGKRVAEVSFVRGAGGDAGSDPPNYGLYLLQDVRVRPWTTYDLSVWVRGIDLVSAAGAPLGFGSQCGLFFWLLGPGGDPATRLFPSGAFPRRDGTTPWELRKMRFTTPPAGAFPPPSKGEDDRFHLALQVILYGTGTVQVDDLRLAVSPASPPEPRRRPGRLALATHGGRPLFGMGIHHLPKGMTWSEAAREKIFNFTTGGGSQTAKAALGILSFTGAVRVDPACRGCDDPASSACAYFRSCPESEERLGSYDPASYLLPSGTYGIWTDEPNGHPSLQGDLDDLTRAARRIKSNAARLLPPGRPFYIYESDMPGGTYFNTYGWDDLALYHASGAFDIVGGIRRGGNPKKGAVGGVMSEFRETSINGIRQLTRRIADDVTSQDGRQRKPVWMIVNGGSGKIVTDRRNRAYPVAPHDAAELLASRPDLPQLRYMLYAAILNGATGLLFYQGVDDTPLTAEDPYWKDVLLAAAGELVTLERDTGFLTEPDYNDLPCRLEGGLGKVDSMVKRAGESWILVLANSSPEAVSGAELVLEGGAELAGPPERLVYRHDAGPRKRRFESVPSLVGGPDRFPLELPGYGVTLYRFRLLRLKA